VFPVPDGSATTAEFRGVLCPGLLRVQGTRVRSYCSNCCFYEKRPRQSLQMNPMLEDVMSQSGRVASDTKVAPPLSSRSPHELCTQWLRVKHRGPTRMRNRSVWVSERLVWASGPVPLLFFFDYAIDAPGVTGPLTWCAVRSAPFFFYASDHRASRPHESGSDFICTVFLVQSYVWFQGNP